MSFRVAPSNQTDEISNHANWHTHSTHTQNINGVHVKETKDFCVLRINETQRSSLSNFAINQAVKDLHHTWRRKHAHWRRNRRACAHRCSTKQTAHNNAHRLGGNKNKTNTFVCVWCVYTATSTKQTIKMESSAGICSGRRAVVHWNQFGRVAPVRQERKPIKRRASKASKRRVCIYIY